VRRLEKSWLEKHTIFFALIRLKREMDAVRQIPNFMSADQKRRVSQVVRDMGRGLMQFIRARVASEADAEDVLQDVWQQLVTTLDAGAVEQMGAWLYTVARNRIIDRYRKPRMASLEALAADAAGDFDLADFFPRDDATPRTEHLRAQFWEQLYAALAELPDDQRQVFVWHELEALSFQDIAELTGEKVNTLLSRKRYAVLHLRRRLEPLRDEFRSTNL
jgi:RNA polymerase sigma factor (sigma-70 family)